MAAEVAQMPGVNGYHGGYGEIATHQTTYHSTPAPSSYPVEAPTSSNQQPEIPKDEVGWYFVEQYYTTLSRSPEKLYLFYNKRSQFVSGQETDKVPVCVGQRAINDRIKDLDFQDCKVRVTNVDSQASDTNIVIQVIGEISNKSQPHKKFTQTFVLATQTNGYFVLNDIFRYLIEEEDEAEQEQVATGEEVQQAPAAESGYQEPAPTLEKAEPKTLTSSMDPTAVEHDAEAVDKELEEQVLSKEEPPAVTNGEAEPEAAEAPAPVVSQPEDTAEEPSRPTSADEALQPEAPKDPSPSPAATPAVEQPPQQHAAPPKPSAPKTWASLAAFAARVPPATPQVPAQQQQQPKQAPAPKPQPFAAPAQTSTPTPTPPTAPAAQREESSPATSSQDEWTAVGGSYNRQQSRQVNQQEQQGPQGRGYIKNVHDGVNFQELKGEMEKYGELVYFDIARQKNSAFVDWKSPEGYQAAVAANPHKIGNDTLIVEERRIKPGSTPYVPRGRGGARGGQFSGGPPREAYQQGGAPPRGGGYAPRGGRGGVPQQRGGRGSAQAA